MQCKHASFVKDAILLFTDSTSVTTVGHLCYALPLLCAVCPLEKLTAYEQKLLRKRYAQQRYDRVTLHYCWYTAPLHIRGVQQRRTLAKTKTTCSYRIQPLQNKKGVQR
jgi:hypothetical protein